MSTVNIQDRKLSIIEQLIILNDDKVFQQVEELINKSLKRPLLSRFTVAELKERAEQANKDIAEGNLYSQEDVEEQTQSW
jgi:hypothetical protein